jgi:cupin 2 domain-containing protein
VWFDQDEDEFVVILSGSAIIKYENGEIFYLAKGDFLYIKAHQKHKVTYTENPTIWLAVFIV